MRADVLVIGSANADVVVEVSRRPGGGETVLGGDTTLLPGGKGANTAVAAARLGAPATLLAVVGTDANADLLLGSLRDAGVDVRLVTRSERPTGAAYITLTPDGENSIVVSPGANAELTEARVHAQEARIASAAVLVASLEVPVAAVVRAVALAAAAGTRPVLNLSPVTELPAGTLAALDPLVVNEHEAAELAGYTGDALGLAATLRRLGPRSVVVTRGAAGAVVADADGSTELPAPRVHAVDTTGAGDAFAGALAAGLARGQRLVDAAGLAVRVATISVTRTGAQPSYPTTAELNSSRP